MFREFSSVIVVITWIAVLSRCFQIPRPARLNELRMKIESHCHSEYTIFYNRLNEQVLDCRRRHQRHHHHCNDDDHHHHQRHHHHCNDRHHHHCNDHHRHHHHSSRNNHHNCHHHHRRVDHHYHHPLQMPVELKSQDDLDMLLKLLENSGSPSKLKLIISIPSVPATPVHLRKLFANNVQVRSRSLSALTLGRSMSVWMVAAWAIFVDGWVERWVGGWTDGCLGRMVGDVNGKSQLAGSEFCQFYRDVKG